MTAEKYASSESYLFREVVTDRVLGLRKFENKAPNGMVGFSGGFLDRI